MDFIVLYLRYQIPGDVKTWAASVLAEHADKRAIISTHDPFEAVPNELAKENDNVFLVLGGHHCSRESLKELPKDSGGTYFQIMQDYQGVGYGGFCNWSPNRNVVTANARYFTFKPAEDKIYAYTYSPILDEFEQDSDSEFTLDYPMN